MCSFAVELAFQILDWSTLRLVLMNWLEWFHSIDTKLPFFLREEGREGEEEKEGGGCGKSCICWTCANCCAWWFNLYIRICFRLSLMCNDLHVSGCTILGWQTWLRGSFNAIQCGEKVLFVISMEQWAGSGSFSALIKRLIFVCWAQPAIMDIILPPWMLELIGDELLNCSVAETWLSCSRGGFCKDRPQGFLWETLRTRSGRFFRLNWIVMMYITYYWIMNHFDCFPLNRKCKWGCTLCTLTPRVVNDFNALWYSSLVSSYHRLSTRNWSLWFLSRTTFLLD